MSATTEPTLDEIQAWMEAHPKVKQGFEMGRPYTMTPRRYIEWLLAENDRLRDALSHYGRHVDGCFTAPGATCSCGLEANLR